MKYIKKKVITIMLSGDPDALITYIGFTRDQVVRDFAKDFLSDYLSEDLTIEDAMDIVQEQYGFVKTDGYWIK